MNVEVRFGWSLRCRGGGFLEAVERVVDLAGDPQSVHQYRQLASHRDHCALFGPGSPALLDSQPISSEVAVVTEWTQNVVGSVDEESSEIHVAALCDA